jgi:hypothetical protein
LRIPTAPALGAWRVTSEAAVGRRALYAPLPNTSVAWIYYPLIPVRILPIREVLASRLELSRPIAPLSRHSRRSNSRLVYYVTRGQLVLEVHFSGALHGAGRFRSVRLRAGVSRRAARHAGTNRLLGGLASSSRTPGALPAAEAFRRCRSRYTVPVVRASGSEGQGEGLRCRIRRSLSHSPMTRRTATMEVISVAEALRKSRACG